MNPKKNHYLVVEIPAAMNKRDTMTYIRDAVRGWVGGCAPDHPLFKLAKNAVVRTTIYDMERRTLMDLRKDARAILGNPRTQEEDAKAILALIDRYIQRT